MINYNTVLNMSYILHSTIKDILIALQEENINRAKDNCINSMEVFKA